MSLDIHTEANSLLTWLIKDALPIWWEKGADHERGGGGFYELLAQDGSAVPVDRRARVQARQIYSFAVGGRLGWNGSWKEAVRHGLDFFIGRYRMPSGLFRTLVHADGSPADDTVWLYDQAFALLALAEATKAFPERDDFNLMAHKVVEALADRRLEAGGFLEAATDHPHQSNPHMHLFEACLAWAEIENSPVWNRLADEIAGLALTKFIDANGALHEFFDQDWAFEPSVDGRIVEPGHQFEWAWLLERWSRLRGRGDAHKAALRLYEIGVSHGIDRARGIAFDQLLDDFTTYKDGARLWPQTERIKAALILADAIGDPDRSGAVDAVEGLKRYLNTPTPGLWRDKMRADGSFVEEPAPASSFYHIVCAISELSAQAKGAA
jgi:mannose/cellobiose epimerase-like protein (N-acyl-D-glucosamine 2-epimerase family)